MKLQWPWSKRPTNPATLSLFRDSVVIGWPRGSKEDECQETADAVEKWLRDGGPDGHTMLMLPWPTVVDDKREPARLSLAPYGYVDLAKAAEQIAKSVASIDRKTVKRRPRIVVCRHPELHPELPA